jgi:hypothetical protein
MRQISPAFRFGIAASLASSSALFLYACGSDDASATGGGDASTTSDASTADGSMNAVDGSSPTDASTSNDASSPKDGGPPAPPLKTCGAPMQLDSLGKVEPQALSAVSFGGKYAFTWSQDSSLSTDGQYHLRLRYFNGSAYTTEQDLGPGYANPLYSGVDSTGKAYFLYDYEGATAGRDVFDLTTGTNVSTTTTPFQISDVTSYGLTGLPHGAMALYQLASHDQIGDLYTDDGGWTNGNDSGVDASALTATNVVEETHLAVDASGKGGAFWEVSSGGGTYTLQVSSFDGAHFSAPVARVFPSASNGAASYFSIGALSNGDLVFAWNTAGATGVTFSTFHPAAAVGSQWDPDLTLATFSGNAFPTVLVDANDTITVAWTTRAVDGISPGEIKVKRRFGSTWTSEIDTNTTSEQPVVVLDPAGNVVSISQTSSNGPGIARMPMNGTAFGALVSTALPTNGNNWAAVAFDAVANPVVASWGTVDGGFHLWVTTCVN